MNFNPTGDRVLIERAEIESKTAGGLIIPDSQKKDAPTQGKIIAISKDTEDELLQIGNVAMFVQSYEITIDDKEYAVVNGKDILGIFKN